LDLQGYQVSDSQIKRKTVASTFIRFEQILYEFGLSPNLNEKLSIKIELDTNPPDGFNLRQTLVNLYFPYSLMAHDLPTFFAGKLHAVLQRAYTKGRDYYDLVFLLSRWRDLTPNLPYLQNALKQTNYQGEQVTDLNWRAIILKGISGTNWDTVIKDVEPFLESGADLQLLNRDNLNSLLGENKV
jgi:predicted nucleotidyltransferase component of viral defense system